MYCCLHTRASHAESYLTICLFALCVCLLCVRASNQELVQRVLVIFTISFSHRIVCVCSHRKCTGIVLTRQHNNNNINFIKLPKSKQATNQPTNQPYPFVIFLIWACSVCAPVCMLCVWDVEAIGHDYSSCTCNRSFLNFQFVKVARKRTTMHSFWFCYCWKCLFDLVLCFCYYCWN